MLLLKEYGVLRVQVLSPKDDTSLYRYSCLTQANNDHNGNLFRKYVFSAGVVEREILEVLQH